MYRTHHTTQYAGLRFLCILAAALLFLAAPVAAQELTVSFPNGNYITDMEIQGNYVWCTTFGSLVRWNKADGTYRQYTEKDGLADFSLYCIEKDDQGNLWLGTLKGLQRFDGNTFTTFNTTNSGLVNDVVKAIAAADNGVIWIGTQEGLSRFDGKTWTNYTTQNSGIPSNYITSIAVDRDGVIWLAHHQDINDKGVSSFDGITWKNYTSTSSGGILNTVLSLTVDTNNVKWFGTRSKLYSFDGKTWAEHAIPCVHDMTVDSKGMLWAAAGVMEGILPVYSLSSYDGKSWTAYPLDTKLDRPIMAYLQVRVDADGTVWFVTEEGFGGAFSLHSYNGTTIKTYHTDGPLNYFFSGIAIDSMNRKWFASDYGVACFDGKSWVNHLFTLTDDDVTPVANLNNMNYYVNWIEGIVVDRENVVWVCSLGGWNVASFDGKAWKFYNNARDNTFMGIITNAIIVDHNNVKWFVGGGVNSFDGRTWTSYKRFKIKALYGAVDNDNVKWFSTMDEGAWSFNGTTWKNYYTDNSPLKGMIWRVAADHNNIKWFVNLDGMIYSFDGTTWKTYGPEVTGLATDRYPVDNLYVDRNNVLWITQRGLTSFDGKVWKTWPNIKTGQGSAIAFDADGYMWIASHYGVGEGGTLSAMKLSTGQTAVAETSTLPVALELRGNYPNPFNPSTTISFSLPAPGKVNLTIYDITGRKVLDLVNGVLTAGLHGAVWDGHDSSGRAVSSGVYFSRLTWNGRTTANRMLLAK